MSYIEDRKCSISKEADESEGGKCLSAVWVKGGGREGAEPSEVGRRKGRGESFGSSERASSYLSKLKMLSAQITY